MNRLALLLALCGSLAIAIGAGLVFLPAGVIAAGVEVLALAYMIQYWSVRHREE